MSFDWQSLENRLYEYSETIIRQFAAEHPDVICSFFAYETDPQAGYFLFSFDTYENSIRMSQMAEQRAIERRNRMLNDEWSWRYARSMLQIPRLTDYSPDAGYFTYPMYAQIDFQELTELSESNAYPSQNNDIEDDYINGNIRIVLWRVVEQLIAHQIFAHLRLATPFHVGYQLHEDELVILRILNWPNIVQNDPSL